jgi:hypothetical protein
MQESGLGEQVYSSSMDDIPASILDLGESETAIDRLTTLCDGADTLSLAVGYLFVDGLAPLLPKLQKLDRVNLLIGNVVNRLTEEQIQEGQLDRTGVATDADEDMFAKGLRAERDRAAVETALNLRRTIDAMPRTDENRTLVIELATLIAKGTVLVRLLTTRRLHAKIALASFPAGHAKAPGAGIVGSSNLTLAASRAGNVERSRWSPDLDVQVEGRKNFEFLNDWFGAHWAEAQDFQKELFDELGQAWPLRTVVR